MVRGKGIDDAPRYAGARDPALQHQVRLRAPVAEGDGTHVPQADGEEDEVAHPPDRVAPVVEELLLTVRVRVRVRVWVGVRVRVGVWVGVGVRVRVSSRGAASTAACSPRWTRGASSA